MRYIPVDDLERPPGWEDDAADALAEVEKLAEAPRKNRNEEIDRHAEKTWRALKPKLMDLSDDKCWYCEMRQDRSLGEVDHFRPKGKILDAPSHPGYWWLAFEPANYRYCCELCNRRTTDRQTGRTGGKRDQFPIHALRAQEKDDELNLEEPMLLDPLVPSDPRLLTWQVNGDPAPRYLETQNKKWHDRAHVSIVVYHLHHHKLRKRRRKIYNDLKLLVQEGDILYAKAATGQEVQQESLNRLTKSIMDMVVKKAELSAAAIQYLSELRTDKPERTWIDSVLATA